MLPGLQKGRQKYYAFERGHVSALAFRTKPPLPNSTGGAVSLPQVDCKTDLGVLVAYSLSAAVQIDQPVKRPGA